MNSHLIFILFCFCLQFLNIFAGAGGKIAATAVRGIVRAATQMKSSPSQGPFSNIRFQGRTQTHVRIMSQNMDFAQQAPPAAALAVRQQLKSPISSFLQQNSSKHSTNIHAQLPSHFSIKTSPEGKSDNAFLKHALDIGKSVVNQMIAEYKSLNGIFEGEKQNVAPARRYYIANPSRILYSRSNLAAALANHNHRIFELENEEINDKENEEIHRIIEMGDEEIDDKKMDEIEKKASDVFKKEMGILEKMFQWDEEQEVDKLFELLPKNLAENTGIKIVAGNKMKWEEMKKLIENIQQNGQKYIEEEMKEKILNTMKQIEMLQMRKLYLDDILPEYLPKKLAEKANVEIIVGKKMELIEMKKIKKYIQENRENILEKLKELLEVEEKEEMMKKIHKTIRLIDVLRMRLDMAEMANKLSLTVNVDKMKKHIAMLKNWRNENKAYFTDNSIIFAEKEMSPKNTFNGQIEGGTL